MERFAALCERAACHRLRVAIEFMPYRGISDAGLAWEIVRRAGQSNGGILVDSWHHYRGAADPTLIRAIPPERVVAVQLSDADAQPIGELREDSRHRRRAPGSGSFDLVGFVRLLDGMGVDVPFGAEIIADDHAKLALQEAARVAFSGASAVIKAARA